MSENPYQGSETVTVLCFGAKCGEYQDDLKQSSGSSQITAKQPSLPLLQDTLMEPISSVIDSVHIWKTGKVMLISAFHSVTVLHDDK